eukprot:296372-Amorphochlora_amoeboformis.AAC.1
MTWRRVLLSKSQKCRYYRVLPVTVAYYRMRRSPRISGISSDLRAVVYVRLYFNTLSISTLRTASAHAIYIIA